MRINRPVNSPTRDSSLSWQVILSSDWLTKAMLVSDWLNQIILSSDWLIQIILVFDWSNQTTLSSDWLTQIILISDWLTQYYTNLWLIGIEWNMTKSRMAAEMNKAELENYR